jgi:hypothetical protein
VLGGEVLRAILSDDLDPGLGERAEIFCGDVLGRRDDHNVRPELGADALVIRANGLRR